jgi:hypothetical protein
MRRTIAETYPRIGGYFSQGLLTQVAGFPTERVFREALIRHGTLHRALRHIDASTDVTAITAVMSCRAFHILRSQPLAGGTAGMSPIKCSDCGTEVSDQVPGFAAVSRRWGRPLSQGRYICREIRA